MHSPERQFNALTPDQEKKNEPSHTPETTTENVPIAETESAMSYLGVSLEKSKSGDGQFVPKREQYEDFINDEDVALPLQRDIAVAFLSGEPLLVDGGTSLGKTTTVRKMAAELGWEIHYANLNGATDVEDLMGRYIPNPHKNKPEDPEYIFADGKVTSGLRQEEGKVKVVILDELNAAAPNILIRLHEVLDSLERGGDVILSEDASEAVSVDKKRTKIIALMNPPGKGFFGREPLDPAQLRRWVYKKLPSELPEGTFSYSTDALFGAEPTSQNVTPDMFLKAREEALTPEQLQEVPGMREVLEKYKEFHKAAKELLKNRKVAEDQPQPFTFDDRMEPRRVRDFVLRFYTGDINDTFQQALRYYYANKLESETDRKKLDELIRFVEYKSKVAESSRKGLKRETLKENFERAIEVQKSLLKNPKVPDIIKEKLKLIESSTELESSFQEQYKTQIEILERIDILQELKSHELGIKGIDGKEYPIPTQAEIAERIEVKKELIEKKQEQGFKKLLIVPFGMKLDDLIEKYKQVILEHYKDKKLFVTKKNPEEKDELLELSEKEPLWLWGEYENADVNGKLVYFPKEFSKNHEGKTKQEIITEQGGWQVILIEDMPNIPREGKGITTKDRKQFEAGDTPNDYLKALKKTDQYNGESGMTPEEQIIYALTHLEEANEVIDDWRQGNGSISYQVGAYFTSGNVPLAAWNRDYRRTHLYGRHPNNHFDYCGVRPAVRI